MRTEKPAYRKKRFLIPAAALLAILILVAWYNLETSVRPPATGNDLPVSLTVSRPDTGLYTCSGSWLRHSTSGLWEMYLQGEPFELGVINGKLTKALIGEQEEAFIARIREMIPSPSYLKFLKYFIYWFNRDLEEYVTDEYKQEIYGISLSASDRFDFIGSSYQRMMNYHSAHDIGHALQDLALVGCTSFGVWDSISRDGSLLIGRNFDFYMGDDFAKNKIVCFVRPDSGYPFVTVTWAGMIGAVSGMNLQGLTVTINAAKSEIPLSARTPISLVAREILQYASNIREATDIAAKRETFVSESILVGSAADGEAVIIEKAPYKTDIIRSATGRIICTNHFQGEGFREDELNRKAMLESPSVPRYRRMEELIREHSPVGIEDAAAILRDMKGLHGAEIGMGNERAVNQLIAHHSVIFHPGSRRIWISAGPWQSGSYICYDLNKIFHTFANLQQQADLEDAALNLPADPFLESTDYVKFLQYKTRRDTVQKWLKAGEPVPQSRSFQDEFIALNPAYYESHALAGDLAALDGDYLLAADRYREALRCSIPSLGQREEIIRKLSSIIYRTTNPKK